MTGLPMASAPGSTEDGNQQVVDELLCSELSQLAGWQRPFNNEQKANIARVFGASPRTIRKYLEYVHINPGVDTRPSAVVRTLAVEVVCR